MPQRGNINADQIRAEDKHGTDPQLQTSDGTGVEGHVALYDASGGLTGGGLPSDGGIGTHPEILTDGAGNPILASGDFIYVLGVPN